MKKEGPHAKVRVNAPDLRRVYRPVVVGRDRAVIDPLARELLGHAPVLRLRFGDGLRAGQPEVCGDLVSQHLFKPQPEQVRRVSAVGSRNNVAAESGRAARATMACGAAIGQPRADFEVSIDVAEAVAHDGPLPFDLRELPLEELAAATYRAERIAGDDEC